MGLVWHTEPLSLHRFHQTSGPGEALGAHDSFFQAGLADEAARAHQAKPGWLVHAALGAKSKRAYNTARGAVRYLHVIYLRRKTNATSVCMSCLSVVALVLDSKAKSTPDICYADQDKDCILGVYS